MAEGAVLLCGLSAYFLAYRSGWYCWQVHFFHLRPLPQGQGSLRPILPTRTGLLAAPATWPAAAALAPALWPVSFWRRAATSAWLAGPGLAAPRGAAGCAWGAGAGWAAGADRKST